MPKRVSLQRVFKLRDKIIQKLSPYVDRVISGETVKDLATDVYNALPPRVSYDAVFETCRSLAGRQLLLKDAATFSWRIAGNLDNLFAGFPIIAWGRPAVDEWWPVQILRLDSSYRRGKSGFTVKFRSLAGSYCPGVFEQFLSRASCAVIARLIGFSRVRPYTHHLHLINLRFTVLIDAGRSIETPYFREVSCPSAFRNYNSEIINIRVRNKPCPFDYKHLCENCAVGCGTCPAAVFQHDLVKKHCTQCATQQLFDYSRSNVICLNCWQQQHNSQCVKTGQ